MAESQILVENGRVSGLFKVINGVAIVIISALLIWMASNLTQLNAQVAVLISQNNAALLAATNTREIRNREHDKIDIRLEKLEAHAGDGHGK